MTASTYGRQVVLPLTNKSGGGVIAGDVVILDSTNDTAFTTSAAGSVTSPIGIAQETIASNSTGRVLVSGQAALVNVNASVTRGNYAKTFTVAKQATDAGSVRVAGTFGWFMTGGTTPSAWVYPVDLAGAALTNPMTAVGDLIQGTTAGAPAALAAPLAGKVLTGAGVTTPMVYSYPPGYQFDYVAVTAGPVTLTATTEATATTIVTGSAITYDGSTDVMVEFFSPAAILNGTAGDELRLVLYDGASSIGPIGVLGTPATGQTIRAPVRTGRKLTPSAAVHTYSVRGYKTAGGATAVVDDGAGGSTAQAPLFIRITKM